MKAFTWTNYLLFMLAVTFLYYLVLLIINYRKNMLTFFKAKPSYEGNDAENEEMDFLNTDPKQSSSLKAETEDEELSELDGFCRALRVILTQADPTDQQQDKIAIKIGSILQQYPLLCEESLRESITELILSEANRKNIKLSEQALINIWPNRI